MDASVVGSIASTAPANLGLALVVVPFLNWAKQKTGPLLGWVNNKTAPAISAAVAFAGAVGIHFAFDASQGSLMITGLTTASLAHGLIDWGRQWASNYWVYKASQLIEAQKTIAASAQAVAPVAASPIKPAA